MPEALLEWEDPDIGDCGRDLALYLARRRSGLTLGELGREFGIAEYKTVAAAIQRFETSLAKDSAKRDMVERFIREMQKVGDPDGPLGNGRLGGTVFGDTRKERIQFNEDSLWVGNEDATGGYQPFGDVYADKKANIAAKVPEESVVSTAGLCYRYWHSTGGRA